MLQIPKIIIKSNQVYLNLNLQKVSINIDMIIQVNLPSILLFPLIEYLFLCITFYDVFFKNFTNISELGSQL